MKIIFRIQTEDGYRIIILSHFPNNRGDMVDVVELSDKKKVHIHGFKVQGSGFWVQRFIGSGFLMRTSGLSYLLCP
jgi:calcineurin-like phosphoesterase family protein